VGYLASLLAGALINTGTSGEALSKLEYSKKASSVTSTYKGGRYCGPGWGFTYRDILDGKIRQLPRAIDAIDEACKMHDYCYQENGYFTQGCNLVLTYDLVQVVLDQRSTAQQRLDAVLMAAIFFVESQTIDLGVLAKREVAEMKSRLLGYISQAGATLESAIKKEMRMRGAAIP
jgi:hypothetical protein